MARGMTHHRRARTSPNAPATVAIGAGLRRLCARVAACRLGSVAIEFAVLLPVFLALIYGLFEFARVAWTQTTLEYAVEEAARFAMVNPTASATQNAVRLLPVPHGMMRRPRSFVPLTK